MNFLESLRTSATGLSAQRLRMNLISSNLANVNTTKTQDGRAYKRKDAVFAAEQPLDFSSTLAQSIDRGAGGVQVVDIREDPRPPIRKYDPHHPDADAKGFVELPNINVVEEMVNMISATRSYEANVTAIKVTKEMATEALEIGR